MICAPRGGWLHSISRSKTITSWTNWNNTVVPNHQNIRAAVLWQNNCEVVLYNNVNHNRASALYFVVLMNMITCLSIFIKLFLILISFRGLGSFVHRLIGGCAFRSFELAVNKHTPNNISYCISVAFCAESFNKSEVALSIYWCSRPPPSPPLQFGLSPCFYEFAPHDPPCVSPYTHFYTFPCH